MEQRIDFIDVARGIAILLVVLGHCNPSATVPLNKVILSFHMPLFFFLSGIFAKTVNVKFKESVWIKTKQILIPHISLWCISILDSLLRCIMTGGVLSDINYFNGLFFWFLPVLFLSSVLWLIVVSLLRIQDIKFKVLMLVISVLMIVSSLYYQSNSQNNSFIVLWLHITPMSLFFYSLGSLSKPFLLKKYQINHEIIGLCSILSIVLLLVIANLNSEVRMYQNSYGNIGLFLFTSVVGIVLTLHLSRFLESSSFLLWAGRSSVMIYVWNFFICGFSQHVVHKIFLPHIFIENDNIGTFLSFFLALILLYSIVKITSKNCPWIYGKS